MFVAASWAAQPESLYVTSQHMHDHHWLLQWSVGSTHCKNSHVEITHVSVPIVCSLLEHVLKQHLYLIHSEGNITLQCTWLDADSAHQCVACGTWCVLSWRLVVSTQGLCCLKVGDNTLRMLFWHNKRNVLKQNNTCCVLNFKQHVPCVISAGQN